MAQPVPYVLGYSFQGWQISNANRPLPADKLEGELSSIANTISQTLANLKLIQRDDTGLANQSVGYDQLKTELVLGLRQPTAWATNTFYSKLDTVFVGGIMYRATRDHTSGVFASDNANGNWQLIANLTTGTNNVSALEALVGVGFPTRIATNNWAQRVIAGTGGEITSTNGDGVLGNPTFSLPAALTFTGKTVTGGTFVSGAFNGSLGATTPSAVAATTVAATGQISSSLATGAAPFVIASATLVANLYAARSALADAANSLNVTADLSFNGHKGTGAADGTLATDLVTLRQSQNQSAAHSTTVAGTVDAITIAMSPASSGVYALNEIFKWTSAGANATTTPTINKDGRGALTLTRNGGAALLAGDTGPVGFECSGIYDGVNVVLQNPQTALGVSLIVSSARANSIGTLQDILPAAGDGVTYCDAALQTLISQTSNIMILPGNYRFKSQILIQQYVNIVSNSTPALAGGAKFNFDNFTGATWDATLTGLISVKGSAAYNSLIEGIAVRIVVAPPANTDGISHNTRVRIRNCTVSGAANTLRDAFRADGSGNCDLSLWEENIHAPTWDGPCAANAFHVTRGTDTSNMLGLRCVDIGATAYGFWDESSYGGRYLNCGGGYHGTVAFMSGDNTGTYNLPNNATVWDGCYCDSGFSVTPYQVWTPGLILSPQGTKPTAGTNVRMRNAMLYAQDVGGFVINDQLNFAAVPTDVFTEGSPSSLFTRIGRSLLSMRMADGYLYSLAAAGADPWTVAGTGFQITRSGVKQLDFGDTSGRVTASSGLIMGELIIQKNYTVATLPAAATALKGARAYVTDATSTTFNAAAVGGGANLIGVTCNGSAWLIG